MFRLSVAIGEWPVIIFPSRLYEIQIGHGTGDFFGFSQFQILVELMIQSLFVGVFFVSFRQLTCVYVQPPCVEAVDPSVRTIIKVDTYSG